MGKAKKNKKRNIVRVVSILLVLGLVALSYWYFSLKAPTLPGPPLKELAAAHKIDLGIHVESKRLGGGIYPDLVSSQFAFATIDGGIHFKELQPTPTKYDFTTSDKIVSFATTHHMPVQLHHLVWGDAAFLPKWLKEGHYTKQQLLDILHSHITNIVKRYKGRVREYAVVNEAFTEAQHVYGLRDWWAEHMGGGTDYIDNYFKWAHQADPSAKLLLNDFNDETKNSVSDAMYAYLKAAKARGVPIDGIGMQMHIDAARPPDKAAMVENMRRFGDIGVPVYITEFDVKTYFVSGSDSYKAQLETQITSDVVRACIESKNCISLSAFGMTDRENLLSKLFYRKSRAYLFTSRYQPKPSFYTFRDAWLEP